MAEEQAVNIRQRIHRCPAEYAVGRWGRAAAEALEKIRGQEKK